MEFKVGDAVKRGDVTEHSLNAYRALRGTVHEVLDNGWCKVQWGRETSHGYPHLVAYRADALAPATTPRFLGAVDRGVDVLMDSCSTGWIWWVADRRNTQVHEGPGAFASPEACEQDALAWLKDPQREFRPDRREKGQE